MAHPSFDKEVDLLVAGGGPGGMTAALVASLEGLDVLICEKTEQVGGTASTSAGTLWIPGNRQSLAAGFIDSAEAAAAYLDSLIGGGASESRHLRPAFLASGPDVIDYLEARTEARFVSCGKHPDYHLNHTGAAIYGRTIVPKPFDGRMLGKDFERVRPPIAEFIILGGMMVGKDDIPRLIGRFASAANLLYTVRLFLRLLLDRLSYSRGTRLVMGNALVARLFYSLKQQSVPILFNARIADLVRDDGAVLGATIVHDGRSMRVRARRGVVLATGGYAHNPTFRAAFMPEPTPKHSLAAVGNQGDGIALGRAAGARIAPENHRSGAFWTPVSVTTRKDGSHDLFPHLSLDRAKPGLIAVNAAGRRFVNEGVSYHDFVEAMFESSQDHPGDPGLSRLRCRLHPQIRSRRHLSWHYQPQAVHLQWLYCRGRDTRRTRRKDPCQRPRPRRVGGPPQSVRRHRRGSRLRQRDFRAQPLQRRPGAWAEPLPRAIITPPFCAVRVWPAEIACSTGLSTDEDARVIDPDGRPIPGLYACGNDMASVMAGTYPGPGTTLGPALVFAFRAAQHAAHGATMAPVRTPSTTYAA